MPNATLQQRIESAKAEIERLEKLSPQERRAYVIQARSSRSMSDMVLMIALSLLALFNSVVILYTWLVDYRLSLMSSLGVAAGLLLSVIVFRFFKANSIESIYKLQSDDFTDEDVLAYLRARKESDQRGLENWNGKARYYLFALLLLATLLFFNRSTREFAVMLVGSLIDIVFIGLVLFALIRQFKYRKR